MARYEKKNYGSDLDFNIEFDESALLNIIKAVKQAETKHIRYGWFDDKKYPASHKNKGMYVAQVAEWQEYGTHHIPARPYAITNFIKQTSLVEPLIEQYFKQACNGIVDLTILNSIATSGKEGYKNLVMGQGFTPLANSTVRIKGHDFQMDHTGYLLSSYNVKVFKTSIDKIDSRIT